MNLDIHAFFTALIAWGKNNVEVSSKSVLLCGRIHMYSLYNLEADNFGIAMNVLPVFFFAVSKRSL